MKLITNTTENKFDVNFIKLICAVGFFLVALSTVSASGKTLAEYREKISEARDLTVVLLYPDENSAVEHSPKFERDALAKIRRNIPAAEKIEWQGGSIETDNRWLSEDLNKIESDSSKRAAILTEIGERLDALDTKIKEIENPSALNRTKDEEKQKLAEILRREEYQKPEKEQESIFQKIYRKIIEWLEKFFPNSDDSASPAKGFKSFSIVLQIILYAVVFGVIVFLVYKFAPFLTERFRRREKSDQKERFILGEKLQPDQSAKNLFDEAEKLAREGNLRAAIRKGYIAFLCELGDRKIIGLSQNKTNRDYLRDVRAKDELYRNMNNLTVNFERHWYGFESVEENDWEEFRRDYRQILGANFQR